MRRTRHPSGIVPINPRLANLRAGIVWVPSAGQVLGDQSQTFPPAYMTQPLSVSLGSGYSGKGAGNLVGSGIAVQFTRVGGGSDAYTEIPDGSDWTYFAYVDNVSNYQGSNPGFWRSESGSGGTFVLYPSTGLWVRNNGTDITSSTARVADTTLAVVVTVKSGVYCRAWINGVQVLNSTSPGSTSGCTGVNGMNLWCRHNPAEYFEANWLINALYWSAIPDDLAYRLSADPVGTFFAAAPSSRFFRASAPDESATAFQWDAFQDNAFQIYGGVGAPVAGYPWHYYAQQFRQSH